ncbi:MAG: hypothetical protein L3J65_12795 [Robiginitomaculum sp.]|nr:hypothetical protein [Robiginitomaculum sp.]
MFIGHYAPAVLATGMAAGTGRLKLWQAFVGAQLVDYVWAGLIMAGVEKGRVTPGFTEASALDLYHMPYTHSLGMAVVWAVVAAVIFGLVFRKQAKAGAVIFGLVVLSHWFMDLIVHVPDLPLWFGTDKYGFGLWNNRMLSFPLEVGIFVLAMLYYLKNTKPKGKAGRIWPIVLIGLMVTIQFIGNFGAPPNSMKEVGITAWILYTLFASLAFMVDRTRTAQ